MGKRQTFFGCCRCGQTRIFRESDSAEPAPIETLLLEQLLRQAGFLWLT
jgi:hypothetical protein